MKKLLYILLTAALFGLIFVPAAVADPAAVPNGAWVIPGQEVSVSSILTNEELGKALYDIEARS